MSDHFENTLNKKRQRAFLVSLGLLAALVAGGLLFGFIEKVRDASDRAT